MTRCKRKRVDPPRTDPKMGLFNRKEVRRLRAEVDDLRMLAQLLLAEHGPLEVTDNLKRTWGRGKYRVVCEWDSAKWTHTWRLLR